MQREAGKNVDAAVGFRKPTHSKVGLAFLTDDNANHPEVFQFPQTIENQAGRRRITMTTFPWISTPSARSM